MSVLRRCARSSSSRWSPDVHESEKYSPSTVRYGQDLAAACEEFDDIYVKSVQEFSACPEFDGDELVERLKDSLDFIGEEYDFPAVLIKVAWSALSRQGAIGDPNIDYGRLYTFAEQHAHMLHIASLTRHRYREDFADKDLFGEDEEFE